MIQLENGEVISAADQAAGIVEGTGKSSYTGMSKVTSIRLPSLLLAQLKGVAGKSGKTLNATMAMLLEVGLEEVLQKLTPETLEQLKEITEEHFSELYDEAKQVMGQVATEC